MSRIAISLNEVLRDFLGQFTYTYDKYFGESNVKEGEITSLDLIKYFKFDSVDKLNNFMYLEEPLVIFGHADELHDKIISKLNTFIDDIEFEGQHEIELVSREVEKSIPSTLFFLSKTGCKASNIRFVKKNEQEWDGVDVLITANPKALESKPKDKISVKIKTSYNNDVKADYELDSIVELFKDASLRKQILTKTITTTYKEIN
jgi:hypothetical protein